QLGLRVDERRTFDCRVNFAAGVMARADDAFKYAADNALLPPDLLFPQFAVGIQASQCSACAGAARAAVVGFASTKHQIPAVHAVEWRRPEQLDVVDLLPVRAGN